MIEGESSSISAVDGGKNEVRAELLLPLLADPDTRRQLARSSTSGSSTTKIGTVSSRRLRTTTILNDARVLSENVTKYQQENDSGGTRNSPRIK